MKKNYKTTLNCIIVLIITISVKAQLQDEYLNSGLSVPNSKMVFSQPLRFSHYSVPSWDYGYKFNSNPDDEERRTGEIQNFGRNGDSIWFSEEERGQVKKGKSDFDVEKDRTFLNIKHHSNFRNKNDSHQNIHNNMTKNYHLGARKNSEFNMGVDKEENGIRGVSEISYQSENNPSKTGSSKSDTTASEIMLGLTNNEGSGFSDVENRKSVTVMGKVKNDSDNSELFENHTPDYSSTRPSDKENNLRLTHIGQVNNYSEIKSSNNEHGGTVKQTDNSWALNFHNKDNFATNPSSNQPSNSDSWRQNIGNIHDRKNHNNGISWNSDLGHQSEDKQNEMSHHLNTDRNRHNYQFNRNQYDFTLRSDISTGRGPLRVDEEGRLEDEKDESEDINIKDGARKFKYNRHLENSRFGDVAWYRDRKPYSMDIMAQRFDQEKDDENFWHPPPWTSTERPAYYITKLDDNVENRHDIRSNNFGESRWKVNSNLGNIQVPGVNGITIADDSSGGTWKEVSRLLPHRNRFAGMKFQNDYHQVNDNKYQYYSQNMENFNNSNSDYNVAQIIEDVPIYEHGLHAGNAFGGNRWNNEYATGVINKESFVDEEVDGEPIKNPRSGTRISTSAPTVVTTYTLPNGTRVVRLRRIVRYRRPAEGEAKSFSDIAKNLVQKKLSKFLSLFTIIRFPNDPCITSSGLNGTCYHQLECKSLGGIASGSCARGYGVCCYFEATCGAITRQNCSYFVNPGFPAPITDMLACILTLQKSHPDVSQIRLDFFDFETLGPTNGTCIDDQFIVTGQNANSIAPVICGSNTGQHMYVDVDNTNGPLRLNMLTMGGNLPRSFRIKLTQIKRGSPNEAPKNCLQYHRGAQGTIESFNYQIPADSTLPIRPGYTNNLNYAICIQKEPGYCTITYTNVGPDGMAYPFQLTNVLADGMLVIPPGEAGAEVFNCPDDYIVINGIRLCGERLNDASVQLDFTQNAPVTDTGNGPFIIPVRTNENTIGRGFRIDYQQNQCTA